jgi:hypothetical protein
MRCGEVLIAAKAQQDHGRWLPWLKDNFGATPETARQYMLLGSNRKRACDLPPGTSLREALKAIKSIRLEAI